MFILLSGIFLWKQALHFYLSLSSPAPGTAPWCSGKSPGQPGCLHWHPSPNDSGPGTVFYSFPGGCWLDLREIPSCFHSSQAGQKLIITNLIFQPWLQDSSWVFIILFSLWALNIGSFTWKAPLGLVSTDSPISSSKCWNTKPMLFRTAC